MRCHKLTIDEFKFFKCSSKYLKIDVLCKLKKSQRNMEKYFNILRENGKLIQQKSITSEITIMIEVISIRIYQTQNRISSLEDKLFENTYLKE